VGAYLLPPSWCAPPPPPPSCFTVEVFVVIFGVYWLALWSGDASYSQLSLTVYLTVYAMAIVAEFAAVGTRQLLYSRATVQAADALHEALLFRIANAPQSFFDMGGGSVATVMTWFSTK
jgi:hypothetical protein